MCVCVCVCVCVCERVSECACVHVCVYNLYRLAQNKFVENWFHCSWVMTVSKISAVICFCDASCPICTAYVRDESALITQL